VPIRGLNGAHAVRLGEGGALPGERIVGILEPEGGITIYPIHSSKLKDYEDHLERWIDVTWDIKEGSVERFPAQIRVTALNEPGTLGQIASIVGAADGNIDKLVMVTRAKDYTEMLIDVEVLDLKHLMDILTNLKNLGVVSSTDRVLS
jgi:(p)ppGpp synthase/HD superfamily hydrolase